MSWDVIGHEWAAHLLQGHIQRGEVRHAYLFSGPSGVGRRTLALQFARAVNCQNPPAPGEFCGQCRACRHILAMQHSDLTVIQAEKEGGTLKVEQVRELQHTLSLSPYEARYRVALLLRFHEANASAQNALLKTLEEAPQQVILMLTADSAEGLLPTIVSRCEVLRLRPIALDRLSAELETRGVDSQSARLLAHLSGGRLGYALRLKDQPDRLHQRQALIEDLINMLGANRRERFSYAEGFAKQERDEIREAYQVWLSFWRDLMLRSASPELPLVNLDMEEMINQLVGSITLSTARTCVTELERSISRLDSNVNSRLLTEVLLLDWPKV